MKTAEVNSKKQLKYISGLDGLRAIAVLMVLVYHLKLPFAKGGLLGVTVFFVISGFLITRILLSEIEQSNTINLRNFWVRRIRRLLPAVLTMVTAILFVSAIFNRVLFTKLCSDFFSAILGYNNWWQIFNHVSYFENAGVPSPLTHCWSLAVETQFYLFYPLLLIVLNKFKNPKKNFTLVTAVLAVVSFALMWILFDPTKDPSRVYYGTDTRAFSLLFGALLALVIKNNKLKIPRIYSEVIGIVSFAGLLYIMFTVDGYSSFLYRGGQGLVSLLTVLIIYSCLNQNSLLGNILSLPPLKAIGDRSYGIYLWHYPIILLISGGKKSSWWIILIEISLTILCSELSYRFIETPIQKGIIGKSLAIINSKPKTRRERKLQIRTLKIGMKVVFTTFCVGLLALGCVIFVPREKALNNIDKLEAEAKEASKITEEKTSESTQKGTVKDAKTEKELLENLNLLLIGDSIALGATDEFYSTFPKSISDTAVSRYTTESFAIYDSYVNEKQWNGDGVIFALGTNGVLYDSLSTLRQMMGTDKPLFIITARAPYASWEESNNQEMYEFAKSTKNTYIVDWYKESENHPEYFSEDETHLSAEGAFAYIECIKEAVLQVYQK